MKQERNMITMNEYGKIHLNKLTTNPRNDIVFMNVRTRECMNENRYRHN